ncbi:MAG TPA: hypothetical protein VK633_07325 [Verrucomicrobiae bacterium]|nr:hypothetical protein [Verrucomicrobiae bacterium]
MTAEAICSDTFGRLNGMSITIELDLPDALANEARAKGLLEPGCVSDLISAELRRRQSAADLNKVLHEIRSQSGKPLGTEEIQSQIDAVRANRRAREAGR